MIKFVNAKINIGLNIVGKREDGYHNLETVFFPIGLESGMPHQPEPFDDILEITFNPSEMDGCRFQFMGRKINCDPKKNLVVRAASLFFRTAIEKGYSLSGHGMYQVTLDKHLPDGAGLGGGSADASFTLLTLNELANNVFSMVELYEMALRLGADCPFFIYNHPCFAEGIGEKITPVSLDLKGKSIVIVKPEVSVSTKEAFSGILPKSPEFDLRKIASLPLSEWKDYIVNDFEATVFPQYPILGAIKDHLYEMDAVYASMSGSGSAIYGIFDDLEKGKLAKEEFSSTYEGVWLFGL